MQTRILRLNLAGQPIDWLHWEEAVCLYSRDLVSWTLGDIVRTVQGGISRLTGERSKVDLPSIIACGGEQLARPRTNSPLNARSKKQGVRPGLRYSTTLSCSTTQAVDSAIMIGCRR
jgi:hypothetical protein